jgi:hypothetical protein
VKKGLEKGLDPAVSKFFAEMGAKGGRKRGEAWANLSAEQRSEAMKALARKRWQKKRKSGMTSHSENPLTPAPIRVQ